MSVNDLSRRSFLAATAASAATAVAPTASAEPKRREKIALLGTVVTLHSHAQHFLDRFLLGYEWDGHWQKPDVDLAALYVDQFPKGELARGIAKQHNLKIYPTIGDALTLGTNSLAVDGVVIIGEHGSYTRNKKGQTLYPRYRFFKQVVKVFEKTGRAVPVFNDKHLSTDWRECVEMVKDSQRLKFPFLAGSSLPVTWRLPAVEVPFGAPLTESVCVGYGGVDSYDFHALETAQCMSERRKGGEVGIKSVQALRDDAMWARAAQKQSTQRLVVSALCRSHNLPVVDGYLPRPISFEWARTAFPRGVGYFIEHRDGFQTAVFMLPIHDFNYAGMLKGGDVLSCQMYLPMPTFSATTADFFNPLVHHIERMFADDRAPYPVERTLLTSGMTLAAVESLYRGGAVVETPDMAVKYTSTRESMFWKT